MMFHEHKIQITLGFIGVAEVGPRASPPPNSNATEEIRLIFDVQLYYSKMIESLSESSTDDK